MKAVRRACALHFPAYRTPALYFLVVLCGFSADFLLYTSLVASNVSIYAANAAGFLLGSAMNVLLIRRFVFPQSRFSLGVDLQLSFISNAVIFSLGMSLLWALVTLAHINPYVAKIIVNGVTFPSNYLIRKALFRGKRPIVF